MALIEHLTWPLSVPTATASSTPIPSSTNPWLEPSSILAYITIAVAIVAAVISIAIMWRQLHYGKQRKYREFTWSNLIDTPMLSIDSQAEREKIKIIYDGPEVEDINLIQLK